MDEGGNRAEGSEPAEGDAGESDEGWPTLSELDLDVCVSEFVPDASTPDLDAEEA